MKKVTTDVDIDCFGRDRILSGIESIFGRIDRPDGRVEKHPTGVYFQNIPRDPVTNMSTLDHRIANDYGYFKVDFLNVNMYADIRDETHLLELVDRDPPWDFFLYREITDQLFHLKGHSNLLVKYQPKSIEDLAMILAIMRPAKAYLQQCDWDKIRKEVWLKVEGEENYQFKRSHSLSYALAIVVNLNLLIERLSKD
jgi:DNA polymerase III alpha subunit